MKRSFFSIIFICVTTIVIAGNHNQKNSNSNKGNPSHTSVINANDTVVLDLSQQVLTGSNILFPVSILSDDTIFSLDFSFKYNQNSFIYDTIIDLVSLQSLSYYNDSDSTVRYTSYSLQNMPIGMPLVSVHFTTLTGNKICSQDFSTVKAYLNGDLCSIKLITCIAGSPSGIAVSNKNSSISIYPNPVNEILNVESAENSTIELFDLNGKTIISKTEILSGEKLQLNISNIADGIYMLKTSNRNWIAMKKVAISK